MLNLLLHLVFSDHCESLSIIINQLYEVRVYGNNFCTFFLQNASLIRGGVHD